MTHDRKISLMTTAEIQRDLHLIRLAYRKRGGPKNRRKSRLQPVSGFLHAVSRTVRAFIKKP